MNAQTQEALKMAIEALERIPSNGALVAKIQKALEQPAQEFMAYEIGTVKLLKYEYGFTYY